MKITNQSRTFFGALIVLAIIASYILLRPFLALLIMTIIITLIYRPIFVLINSYIGKKKEGLAATFTVVIMFLSVVIPLSITVAIVTTQLIKLSTEINSSGSLSLASFSLEGVISELNRVFDSIPFIEYEINEAQVIQNIKGLISPLSQFALDNVLALGSSAMNIFTGLIIFTSVSSAILINHDRIFEILHTISPLPNEIDKLYFDKLTSMATAMVKGTFIIALCQSLVTGIFMWIAGVDYISLIMLIAFILSFLPLGSGFIVVPIAIAQLITGNYMSGLFLLGTFLIITSNLDNILRPMLVPKNAELHPALTIVGLFAGLQAFGFLGIIFGPMLMIFIATTFDVYVRNFKDPN